MQNIGIVGAGGIARAHLGNYKLIKNANVTAVCDLQVEAAKELAELANAEPFSSLEEMLSTAKIDAVDICTPTDTHAALIKAVAKAGKHIFVEKPLARTYEQALESIDAAKSNGVRMYVGQVLRWFPQYTDARETVESGKIGEPVIARSSKCSQHPGGWFADYDKSGGVVLDLLIHDFDWFRLCFGDVERVYAKSLSKKNIANIDYALITLKHKNGVIGHIEGSWAHSGPNTTNLEIACTQGLYTYDSRLSGTVSYEIHDADKAVITGLEAPTKYFPMYNELKDFVDGLETGNDFAISPDEAAEAVKIAEAALESIETGKPVWL